MGSEMSSEPFLLEGVLKVGGEWGIIYITL
jgi:hypothetical protein